MEGDILGGVKLGNLSNSGGDSDILGSYRLTREGITVSRLEEDGVVHTYRQGDEVRITGRKAKEIGAEKVEGGENITNVGNVEIIKTFRQVEEKTTEEGKNQDGKTIPGSNPGPSVVSSLSSLSHLPFDKAIDLISKITLSSDLQLAKEIEMKGKNRKSVMEAINARQGQIK